MSDAPRVLLINPWVYDFAAYDYFARPLGLLYLTGELRARGYRVRLIDCLARGVGAAAMGRYAKEILPTPPPLAGVRRRYGRYGISPAAFIQALRAGERPAVVLVTSLMTYWYPGVQAVIAMVREHLPEVPVLLGGIYASLCPEHARATSGADRVITGPGEEKAAAAVAELTGFAGTAPVAEEVYPALDLLEPNPLIPLLTSRGCPFNCPYCASKQIQPRYQRRPAAAVGAEIAYWSQRRGATEVAFYDDALLVEAEYHLLPILDEVQRRCLKLRFHTPNGLHVGLITPEVARGLKRAGFASLRLGLETTAMGETRRDVKVQAGELETALAALREAGFQPKQIGVYLLMGLPEQDDDEVAASIRRVKALQATPVLTLYSPIPHTELWAAACRVSRYDLAAEPLAHNNSIFPCWPEFSWTRYTHLKNLATG